MSSGQKVALVTGCSSGIGLETAIVLAKNGFLTYATMRNTSKGKEITERASREKLPIRVTRLDVTNDDSVKEAVGKIISEAGKIDLLVNNAGYGVAGAFEDTSVDEAAALFETNLFGVMRVTQAVLPQMRKQRSGVIVNISSGAGRMGYPCASLYVSSKFAVEGMSEALAYELDQFGIRVALVEPGLVSTNFGNAMVITRKAQDPKSPYAPLMQKMNSSWGQMIANASTPELIANKVLEAATSGKPELRYPAGKDMEGWMQAKSSMSEKDFFAMMKQNLLK